MGCKDLEAKLVFALKMGFLFPNNASSRLFTWHSHHDRSERRLRRRKLCVSCVKCYCHLIKGALVSVTAVEPTTVILQIQTLDCLTVLDSQSR